MIRSSPILAGIICVIAFASSPRSWAQSSPALPDNTGVNATEHKAGLPTADQQSNNKADVELTRQIRRAVVKDASLSTMAHNIKIISSEGKVILKGPVKSEREKAAIGAKAQEIAGGSNVANELMVKNP